MVRSVRGRDTGRVGIDVALDRRIGGLIGAEEPRLVHHDRTGQGSTRFKAVVLVFRIGAVFGLGRDAEDGPKRRVRVAREPRALVAAAHCAIEFVRAALGQHVDDAAGRAAEFRRIAGGLDLHFFDEIRQQALARQAADDVAHLDAVDDVPILGRGGAVDHHARGLGLLIHPGRLRQERGEIAAVRQEFDLFSADVGRLSALLDVHDGRFRGDRHLVAQRRQLQAEIGRLDRSELDLDVRDLGRLEARQVGADFVGAGQQRREAEIARAVGHGR